MSMIVLQIAHTLAVLISKIARIDYPKEWYASLLHLCGSYFKESSQRLSVSSYTFPCITGLLILFIYLCVPLSLPFGLQARLAFCVGTTASVS